VPTFPGRRRNTCCSVWPCRDVVGGRLTPPLSSISSRVVCMGLTARPRRSCAPTGDVQLVGPRSGLGCRAAWRAESGAVAVVVVQVSGPGAGLLFDEDRGGHVVHFLSCWSSRARPVWLMPGPSRDGLAPCCPSAVRLTGCADRGELMPLKWQRRVLGPARHAGCRWTSPVRRREKEVSTRLGDVDGAPAALLVGHASSGLTTVRSPREGLGLRSPHVVVCERATGWHLAVRTGSWFALDTCG
jgi:hypothetical protein